MRSRRAKMLITAAATTLLIGACGGDSGDAPPADAAPRAEAAALPRSSAAPGATVFFITPLNGAEVTSPVTVKFGVSGVAIQPAGIRAENSGHHHLLINTDLANPDMPIPSDEQHLHFGKGQTETAIELPPGEHTLQLVLGDANHVPHVEPVASPKITLTVQ